MDSDFVKFRSPSTEILSEIRLGEPAQISSDIEFSILRLDLSTPWAMGNKYFKLKKNLEQLALEKARRVLSFGGAWSNHLLALAQAAQANGIQAVGVIRGDEGFDNALLARMRLHGMQLHFISRSEYRQRHEPGFCEYLCQQLHCDSWLPEGGANQLAVSGCEQIADLISEQGEYTRVVTAVGTGATLAGIVRKCSVTQSVTGIQVVNDPSVVSRVEQWVGGGARARWSLFKSAAINPYAKPSKRVLEFIVRFYRSTGIALDPVYTGPALSVALSAEFLGSITSGEKVVFVHTGGLAGTAGYLSQLDQCTDQAAVKKYLDLIQALTRLDARSPIVI